MDDQREMPDSDEPESVNDEFAPVISSDPAIPPEKEVLGGQPLPERDEPGPYGLDREGTEPVDTEAAGGGLPNSEYSTDPRMQSTDPAREESNEAWPETRGGWDDTSDKESGG